MSKKDIAVRQDIELLVDSFYNKVLKDDTIGFIFTDVAKLSLEKHMPIMYSFWESMLLSSQSYEGNPMTKHIALNKKVKLDKEHFERWLLLWEETVNELFEGGKAKEAITRAKSIAAIMQVKVSHE